MGAKRVDLDSGLFTAEEAETSELEKYLGRKRDPDTGELVERKKRSRATMAASSFERTKIQTVEMMRSRDWAGCSARHLVALYDLMHAKTYGFEPTLSGAERHRYTLLAGGFVKRAFAGDFEKAIDFFRWVWTREMERERWRRENVREGGRLGIGLLFSGRVVDDYRAAMARVKRVSAW